MTYRTSPIKTGRRSKLDILTIRDSIFEVVSRYKPMTVRQVFYQLVTRRVIAKTEAEYKGTVCRLLVDMRRDGTIPYHWIADNTRWMRKPHSYSGLQHLLDNAQRFYRRDVWDWQDVYVEVWLEKEALAGVLYDVTAEWDVPLMVTRGYPSLSYMHSAAETIASQCKPAHLYYFGDHDPSGVDITRHVEAEIRKLAPRVDLTFERVAVTRQQIIDFDLQTRPTKKTDSRAKSFEGESVEVDAIPPDDLRDICRRCIEQHVDDDQLERMREVESAERDTLARLAESIEGAA